MNIYKPEGWLDADSIIQSPFIYQFIIGGRGIGKSYGVIDYFIKNNLKFIYLRRTQVEAKLQADPVTSQLMPNFKDREISPVFRTMAEGKIHVCYSPDGKEICLITALTAIASLRGISLDDYDYIVYDEFITEPHVRQIKAEGMALANAYETINRNRELKGRPPVKMICLANSLNIANDIFMYYDLIEPAENMLLNDEEIFIRNDILLIISQHSPISEAKRGTALYMNVSEEFAKMAISNKFILNDFAYVKKRKLSEYIPKVRVGSLYIYRHKTRSEWYVCSSKSEVKEQYSDGYADLARFQRKYFRLWARYLDGGVRFDSYKSVALFEKYYKV